MSTNLMKELSELQKKSVKYDNIKERYMEHASKLKEIIKMSQELLTEIDPASGVGRGRSSSGVNFQELATESYQKMLEGVQISSNLLAQTYPNLDNKAILYLMKTIQDKYKGKILKRKEGIRVFLYVQKEI